MPISKRNGGGAKPNKGMSDRLELGQPVVTWKDYGASDWGPEARRYRRWGVSGIVTDISDSHGLCYEVKHRDDGTVGWYEPRELKFPDGRPVDAKESRKPVPKPADAFSVLDHDDLI